MIKTSMYRLFAALIVVVWCGATTQAQVQWQRSEPEITGDVQVFHATKVVGLPTAQMMQRGDFEFEISHRLVPPIKDGYDALFGFDGPVKMRLAVSYALRDNWAITLARSSIDANTELATKYRLLQSDKGGLPLAVALQVGAAWNPVETSHRYSEDSVIVRSRGHERHLQSFAQAIFDFEPINRVAAGLVPSFLYNRDITTQDIENSFVLGVHGQLFLNRHWSIIGEFAPLVSGKSTRHHPAAVGVELETGAHIFEMFVTNQLRINPAQFLAGADYPFDGDNLRVGFMITRVL